MKWSKLTPGNIYMFIRRRAGRVVRFFERYVLRMQRKRPAPHSWEFAVCAMFKNEASYLEEWLAFHQLAGVDHFFMYDDASTDDFMPVLKPWIERGMVTLRHAGKRRQAVVYNHCLRNGARAARWIAYIDIDEFLFNPNGETLPSVMERYSSHPAVFVHWVLFGSNGHEVRPDGGVIDSYTRSMSIETAIQDDFEHARRDQPNRSTSSRSRNGKSIIDPRSVLTAGIHRPHEFVWGGLVDERFEYPDEELPRGKAFTCDVLRLNHYWSKSIEELRFKVARGTPVEFGHRFDLELSLERERLLNEVEDHVILHARKKLSSSSRVH